MCKQLIYLVSFVLVLSVAGNAPADIIAHWRLDDGSGTMAVDSVGNNDGTLQGDPTWTAGWIGAALELDGDDYVECGNSDELNITEQVTLTAWIRPDADFNYPDWSGIIMRGGPNIDTFAFYYNGPNQQLGFKTTGSNPPWMAIAAPGLFDGEWHHVAAVYDGARKPVYLDGEEIGTMDSTGMIETSTGRLLLGAGRDITPPTHYLVGLIDDARIYDEALPPEKIQGTMQGGEGYPYALGAVPKDGAMLEDTWVNLSWKAGDTAASHDVYLGDNFDDVNDGAEGTFHGNQTSLFLVAGFPGFPFPDGLVPGTTYYWRIDEVEADGATKYKGHIWSFSIPPKTTYNPDPADGAELVEPDVHLSWTAGFGAKLHTVYFGENFDDVDNATGGLPQGIITYTPPGPLKMAKTYYWRVDEYDAIETYKGDVWSFTTEGAVGNPDPANGAVDVKHTPTLTWSPGIYAASHQVYFGADEDAVKNADTSSPEYKGSGNLGAESYESEKLEWNTTYYWRIDEANNVNPDSPWTGKVWSFTTANFLVVDDFESYNDIDPPEPGSNRIFEAWPDGYDIPTNGALVGNDFPPYAEQTIVHGGIQSMPLYYDNSVGNSEATHTLTYPRDWTEKDVNTLTLSFRGDTSNAAERMYVALNGSAVVYHDNPNVTQIPIWTGWNIDLQAFADQGVDLTNVNTIAIGFGDKANPVAGGSGKMYFDDIQLATAAARVGRVLLFAEDFESVVLGTTVEESAGTEEVWTDTPPAGWIVDNSGIPGVGDPAVDGVTEWAGWAFVQRDWWFTVDPQGRDNFQLGQGAIAVTDPDEWDDSAHPPGYNVAEDSYDTWLSTPAIDISDVEAGTVQLEFDSSWRPEFDGDYHQSAIVTVAFDGGEEIELLLWLSDPSSPKYKPENLAYENETVMIEVDNPSWAKSMVLTFGLFDAGNDWWWAIDNIKISGLAK